MKRKNIGYIIILYACGWMLIGLIILALIIAADIPDDVVGIAFFELFQSFALIFFYITIPPILFLIFYQLYSEKKDK